MSSEATWVVWTAPLGRADRPEPGVRPNVDLATNSAFCAACGPDARARAVFFCFLALKRTFRGAKAELEVHKGRAVSARHGRSACVNGSPIGGLDFSADCSGGCRMEKIVQPQMSITHEKAQTR